MAKGSQNKNTSFAYNHALKGLGKKRVCNGIFHKGYPEGNSIDATLFKRMGEDYQAFCSDCDQARQSFQKTLKRLAALIMIDNKFRISIDKKYFDVQNQINKTIEKCLKNHKLPLETYTSLVDGEFKLTIKGIGFYDNKLSVADKKEIIKQIDNSVRNDDFDKQITKMVRDYADEYYYECSTCKEFYPLGESLSNHSQSRKLFNKNQEFTNLLCPLHNLCLDCSGGRRSDSIRHFHYLCSGDFFQAQKVMTEIGKKTKNSKIHADHIIPLRLGGKHDPVNLRPLSQSENIFKKDKITKELLDYLEKNKINFKDLLTEWYHYAYDLVKANNEKVIEVSLRNAVDEKRKTLIKMSEKDKKIELLKLYPTLNNKNLDRIIRKSFT